MTFNLLCCCSTFSSSSIRFHVNRLNLNDSPANSIWPISCPRYRLRINIKICPVPDRAITLNSLVRYGRDFSQNKFFKRFIILLNIHFKYVYYWVRNPRSVSTAAIISKADIFFFSGLSMSLS